MEIMEAVILSGLTGIVSAVATVAAIRTDISWIKTILKDYGERISRLEEKIS